MKRNELLHTYLFGLPVPERDDFAQRCGQRRQFLQDIAYGNKPCPPGVAVLIERESAGAVPVESTYPKIDWAYIRGTPKPKLRRTRRASK